MEQHEKYGKPTEPTPTDEEIEAMIIGSDDCFCIDGCGPIEPDGHCEHNSPSWLIYLNLI